MDLDDFQQKVIEIEEELGYSSETVQDKIVFLVEEFGELVQSIYDGGDVSGELADCLFLIGCIANRLNEKLDECFKQKFGDRYQHCINCDEILTLNTIVECEGDVYCKECYRKLTR